MFNRFARLWGRKSGGEQDAVAPAAGQVDRGARQGDKDSLDRSLERYRQQSAERERQWREAQVKQAESVHGPAATWPRLSKDLPGPRHPHVCQSCGRYAAPPAPAELPADPSDDDAKRMGDEVMQAWESARTRPLRAWQEHDDEDRPEPIAVVLCRVCGRRLIGPHPRLYQELALNQPFAGVMELCVSCRFRNGVRCAHPDLKANGGPGLAIPSPSFAHVCGRLAGPSGDVYLHPPTSCAGYDPLAADESHPAEVGEEP